MVSLPTYERYQKLRIQIGVSAMDNVAQEQENTRQLRISEENRSSAENERRVRMEQDSASQSFINASFKKCPGCRSDIKRISDCYHMQCTKCNNHFCWRCLHFYVNNRHICHEYDEPVLIQILGERKHLEEKQVKNGNNEEISQNVNKNNRSDALENNNNHESLLDKKYDIKTVKKIDFSDCGTCFEAFPQVNNITFGCDHQFCYHCISDHKYNTQFLDFNVDSFGQIYFMSLISNRKQTSVLKLDSIEILIFTISSEDFDKISLSITSPNAHKYDSNSSELSRSEPLKRYQLKLRSAESGVWTINFVKHSKQTLSATVLVTSQPLNLNVIQMRVMLKDADSVSLMSPIIIAKLSKGRNAVIGGEVMATVDKPDGTQSYIQLINYNNYYMNYFTDYCGSGRYNVSVLAKSELT